MKKCLLVFIALVCPSWIFSQCTPSSNTVPGVTPDIATNLPIAYAGNYYSTVIQVRTPLDTTLNGTYVKLTSVTITGIGNLPAGFTYSCNPSNCTLGPLSNGCMQLTGNPTSTQAGTYLLDIDVTISGKLYGVIPVTQQTKISDYKIKIVPRPVANFILSDYNSCTGDAITFTDKSTNYPTSYQWTFTGGTPSTSTLKNPTVVYSVPGNYTVKLKATSPAGSHTVTKSSILHVNALPTAALTSYRNDTICSGDSIRIVAVQGTSFSYQWYKDGTLLPNAKDYYYYARKSGNYHVRMTKTTTGCSAESPAKYVLSVVLNATVSGVNGLSTCSPKKVNLVAHQNSNFSYKWYRGSNPISGANASTYAADKTGDYKVRVTNPRGCSRISAPVHADVFSKPAATITPQGATTFCQGQSVLLVANTLTGSASYDWFRNGNPISGAHTRKLTATQQGWYTVRVSNQYGCSTLSTRLRVTVNCRMSADNGPVENTIDFRVSPNPARGSAVIAFELPEKNTVAIDLVNMLGEKETILASRNLDSGEHEIDLDTHSYPAGIYFIRLQTNAQQKMIKLIIE